MEARRAIGIDIGHTNFRCGLVDENGTLLELIKEPTAVGGGPEGVAEQVFHAVRRLSAHHCPEGVGVGIAGQCDPKRGVVRCGPNLFWPDVPFRDLLASQLDLPVVLRNDVVMATIGEWQHGSGRGCRHLVALFSGSGIGGGAIVGGALLDGSTGCGGHFGHISVQLDGPRCGCGRRGCVEAYASGGGLATLARNDPALPRSLLHHSELNGAAVAAAVEKGDELAVRLRDQAAEALVSAVSSLINCFDPERVVLGGAIVNGMPELFERTASGAADHCLPCLRGQPTVVRSELGDLAGVIGAASSILRPL